MRPFLEEHFGNPSSSHAYGRITRQALDQARSQVARLINAKPAEIIFTSGGTEANNLAILGLLATRTTGHLITSAIEHPSLLGPVAQLELRDWQVTRIGADENGVVRLEELAVAFRADTQLVSIMAANNETGVLQPLREIGTMCSARAVPFHTDATQWVGKLPLSFHGDWQLAALSCTAHKFHGPLGCGALLVRHDVSLAPQLFGGHQQGGERPGTESVSLAIGMQAALAAAHREAVDRAKRVAGLRDEFESLILSVMPDAVAIGQQSPRLPNTSNIAFPGIDRQALFLALDAAEVACSTGSACASGSSEPPR